LRRLGDGLRRRGGGDRRGRLGGDRLRGGDLDRLRGGDFDFRAGVFDSFGGDFDRNVGELSGITISVGARGSAAFITEFTKVAFACSSFM
jgi:hypothetical protein